MRLLRDCIRFIDKFNDRVGYLISWLTTLLVLVVCYDVFTRYILKKSSVAVQEIEWHIFAVIFLIAGGYTLRHDRHVRVDVLYARLNDRQRAWIDLIGNIIFLIPFSLLIILSSKDFVLNSFLIKETSPDPGGLPGRYILKSCIPLGFIIILLQGISNILKSLFNLFGKGMDG
ncbi:MAG: TRAP transporter small permease subunit [Thermodesulfovibrionia bacterium]